MDAAVMIQWNIWDYENPYREKLVDGKNYLVTLDDDSEIEATYDNYTESYCERPLFWVVKVSFKIGNRMEGISHPISRRVRYWKEIS